ncbi:MAG: T9SS C-terminal target domain-containing protein [Bacteroidetes bacterium]|nr:MAG: T9SS C-terminal target domain-containing protein [Bacteroidota bacterium]
MMVKFVQLLVIQILLALLLFAGLPRSYAQDTIISTCILTDYQGLGGHTLWIDGLPSSQSVKYRLVSDGQLTLFDDSTAHISGQCYNESDSTRRWDIDMWLINHKNFSQWIALGHGVQSGAVDPAIVISNQQNWSFWQLDSTRSKLTGATGSYYAGDTLLLKHSPASLFYGFQMGVGANAENNLKGVSGGFSFSGDYTGSGRLNSNLYCNGDTPMTCVMHVDSAYTTCQPNGNFSATVVLSGAGNSFMVKDSVGNPILSGLGAGSHTFGNYASGEIAVFHLSNQAQAACPDTHICVVNTCQPLPDCIIALDSLYTVCTSATGFNVFAEFSGNGGPYVIQDDQGGLPVVVPATGIYDLGFFLNSIDVSFTIGKQDVPGCSVSFGPVTADCTPVPTCDSEVDTLYAFCVSDSTFKVAITFTGSGSNYVLKDVQGIHSLNGITPGTYILGPYVANTYVNLILTDLGIFGCTRAAGIITANCVELPEPSNAHCADAIPLACNKVIQGTTIGSTSAGPPSCGTMHTGPGVWYSFMGTGQKVTLNTCGNTLPVDTRMSVYKGDCNKMFCALGNDDAPFCSDGGSEVSFKTTKGTPYMIYISTAGSTGADFTLKVSCTGPVKVTPIGPNPIVSVSMFKVNLEEPGEIRWEIYDIHGHVAARSSASGHEGENEVTVEAGKVPEGLYMIRFQTDKGELGTAKVIIKR